MVLKNKEKYLDLANGEYIPCFGLTGPHNGSDAAGKIDTGKSCNERWKENYSSKS